MFEDYGALAPLREAADLLAERDWPKLYDAARLRENEVPTAAAIYAEDMYVERAFSEQTAAHDPRPEAVGHEDEYDTTACASTASASSAGCSSWPAARTRPPRPWRGLSPGTAIGTRPTGRCRSGRWSADHSNPKRTSSSRGRRPATSRRTRQLVQRTQAIAFGPAYLVTRNAADAEEAAQDGFLKA